MLKSGSFTNQKPEPSCSNYSPVNKMFIKKNKIKNGRFDNKYTEVCFTENQSTVILFINKYQCFFPNKVIMTLCELTLSAASWALYVCE